MNPAMAAELERCLHRLVALFPDPDFIAHPPNIVLERHSPLEPVERDACIIPVSRRDLGGSAAEILTILLHKMIHAFHAFLWQQDCTRWSYHTQSFRRLAEHVGFHVGWAGRYGWAQTRPSRSLVCLFEDIALSAPLCEPFRHRRQIWHCGQLRFPDRADLVGDEEDSRRLVHSHSLQVHGRGGSPMVRLSGRWLCAFGFAKGVRLKVEAQAGRLVIEARPESASLPSQGRVDPETWR